MSGRRHKAELQFGSDSFLDVVANIVGILIILIVIAGLRVSKIPTVPKPTSDPASSLLAFLEPAEPEDAMTPDPSSPVAQDQMTSVIALQDPETPTDEKKRVRPPLPELVAPEELVEVTEKLAAEIDAMKDEDAKLAKRMKRTGQQQAEMIEQQKAIREKLKESLVDLEESRKLSLKAQDDLELARESLVRLAKEFKEIENKPVHVEKLEHKVTPVSRIVNGNEKHYRLEKNRVIEVPVDELTARLKEQIERRKDWLIKTRQHKGEIGPIRGFQMHYLVRVDPLSALDDVRSGYGGYRISLGQWEIIPEPDTKGETEAEALRKGSNFYLSLIGAQTDTTLTFWVYPDSYGIYRKLQKFAHEHGFSVAGRPLPPGYQISASPNGSKSAGQ